MGKVLIQVSVTQIQEGILRHTGKTGIITHQEPGLTEIMSPTPCALKIMLSDNFKPYFDGM